MKKGKTFKEVIAGPEFKIFMVSVILTFIVLFPWSKIHYGDAHSTHIINKDTTSKNRAYITGGSEIHTIVGDNNHVVGGSGNYVGINGDVSNEKSLTDKEATHLLANIRQVQKINGIQNNNVLFYITDDSNQKKYSYQLKQFLMNRGFKIVLFDAAHLSLKDTKITVDSGFMPNNEKAITIWVGTSLK